MSDVSEPADCSVELVFPETDVGEGHFVSFSFEFDVGDFEPEVEDSVLDGFVD